MRVRVSLCFLLCLTVFAASLAASAQNTDRSELRAFWVDGFHDGFKTPSQCDTLLARLRAAHCNAVFVEVRKRADAYYHSHYEPWAADDADHFDALAYLCSHAHQAGLPRIQVHAWINACAISGNKNPRSITQAHPDWYSLSDSGSNDDQEAIKVDPGNPEAAEWIYCVYLDIVRHYDVDGIHFDFIRYGGDGKTAGHWGYNPVSVARYNACYGTIGQPAWNDPRWQQWRRDQVTALVRRVYVNAIALKPKLIVSAATICWGQGPMDDVDYEKASASYSLVYAPWRDWLREGILDLNCPMTYFSQKRHPDYWARWSEFVKDHQYGRLSALGSGIWLNNIPNSLHQIDSTRDLTPSGHAAAGTVLYSYAETDTTDGKTNEYNETLYSALSTVFPTDLPPPVMSWKEHPTTGCLQGTLLRGDLLIPSEEMIVTAEDRRMGVTRKAASDSNGFFAFVDLPPGDYTLTAMSVLRSQMRIQAGKVCQVQIVGATVPPRTHVAGIGRLPTGQRAILLDVLVTNGSDRLGDYFFVADDWGRFPMRVNAPHLSPPTVAGDKVALSGTILQTPGGPVLKAIAVRHLGAVLIP